MLNVFRYGAVALLVLLVGACSKPLEVAEVTNIKSKTGSSGLDVHQAARSAGQDAPEFAGDQLAEVRAYHQVDGKGQVELAGVPCHLSTAHFEAKLTTPAKVRVPLYRGKSSDLAVSCKKPGYISRLVTVRALDITRSQRLNSGANAGLVGLLVVAAIDAASDNTKNDWKYPPVKVLLERVPNGSAS